MVIAFTPASLGPSGNQRRIDRILIPAEAHLERYRDRGCFDRRFDQRKRMIRIAHQRRSGIAAGDLLRGTAHVDVDDIGAIGLDDPRRLGHPVRFTPGELHDVRIDAGILQPRPGFGGVTDQFAARHHLGHDEPRAETPGKHAKGQIRHAGHRRERYAIADFDIPDQKRG